MEKIQEIFTDKIDDPVDPMRGELEREALFELSNNIKQNGLINPITVRPIGDRYEVVAGHRRLSACKIAGIIRVQCVVRELDDQKAFEVMAAENLERADVDPVDEANFITRYIAKTGKSVADVATSLKRSVAYVNSRIEVGSMPEYMKEFLKSKQLKLGVALILNQIDDEQTRQLWTGIAVRDGASVAQAEYWLYDYNRQKLPGGTLSTTPPDNFTPDAPQTVMFECALDGEKYDARLFKTLMIYEGNVSAFNEFVFAFREALAKNNSGPAGE